MAEQRRVDSAHRVLLENILLQRTVRSVSWVTTSPLPPMAPCPHLAPAPRHLATYPKGLQVREVSLGAEQHVVGHAEALPHTKVVEERGLRQGAAHLQHHHVCGGAGGGPEPQSLAPQAGEEPGRLSWLR